MKKKAKKNANAPDTRELIIREDGQEYGRVTQVLGSGRFRITPCGTGRPSAGSLLCKIRGAIHRRMWIVLGDLVLFSTRDYEEEKGDIILKYSDDEARRLKQFGEVDDISLTGPSESDDIGGIEFSVDAL